MSLIAKLTVTPLLYACGTLLIVCLALGIALKVASGNVAAAEAAQATAEAKQDTAITERDAWKGSAASFKAANERYSEAVTSLRAELAACQGENRRISTAGQSAIAAAQADAADADRALKRFAAQFQSESRKPPCARALEALGQACPALEGY